VQLTIFAASQGADLFHRFIGALEQFATSSRKSFPSAVSVTRASCVARVHADLIFQVLYLPAQRGLSDPKLRSGLVKSMLHHGEKYRRCLSSIAACHLPESRLRNQTSIGTFKRGGKLLT